MVSLNPHSSGVPTPRDTRGSAGRAAQVRPGSDSVAVARRLGQQHAQRMHVRRAVVGR